MVKVHIYPRQTYHIGRNIVPCKVFRQTLAVIGGQRAFTVLILILCQNMAIGTDQKTGCTAGRVYVPADFDTKEKALSGAKAAEKGLK